MRIIKLGNYEFEQWPRKGWRPPNVRPRVTVYETLGGIKAVVGPGHIGDEAFALPFDWLDARPAKTELLSQDRTGTVSTLIPGQRAAKPIAIGAGGYIPPVSDGVCLAPSAARLHLIRSAGAAGRLSLEVWIGADDLPTAKLGWITSLDVSDLDDGEYLPIDFWGLTAPPVNGDGVISGWIVLCADALTAGSVGWRGLAGAGDNSARYVDGDWELSALDLDATIWQGGQYQVLRGFEAAYDGGHEWILDLGGPLYRVIVDEVAGGLQVPPLSLDSEEAMSDEVEVRFTVLGVT